MVPSFLDYKYPDFRLVKDFYDKVIKHINKKGAYYHKKSCTHIIC